MPDNRTMAKRKGSKRRRIWISKRVLTQGIVEAMARVEETKYSRPMAVVGASYDCYFGREFHYTEADAIDDGLKRIESKRKSIAKQLKKLDELEANLQKRRAKL